MCPDARKRSSIGPGSDGGPTMTCQPVWPHLHQPVELGQQRSAFGGRLGREVAPLVRVVRQVEQQASRRGQQPADGLVAPAPRCVDDLARPELGRHQRAARRRRGPGHQRAQAQARERGGARDAGQVQQRGGHVHVADRLRHAQPARPARGHQHEGNVQEGLEQAAAVARRAVLAELLAVVGGHRQDRPAEQPAGAQQVGQGPQLGVVGSQLAVVEVDLAGRLAAGEAAAEAGPPAVGGVQVERVDVGEEALVRVAPQPAVGAAREVHRLGLQVVDVDARRAAGHLRHAVEALGQAERAGGDEGVVHEGGRGVASRPEGLGQGHVGLVEAVVDGLGAVLGGGTRGEQAGGRGLGPGGTGRDVLEEHAVARQGVEARRGAAGVAVGAHVVGAQAVDHVEHDAGARVVLPTQRPQLAEMEPPRRAVDHELERGRARGQRAEVELGVAPGWTLRQPLAGEQASSRRPPGQPTAGQGSVGLQGEAQPPAAGDVERQPPAAGSGQGDSAPPVALELDLSGQRRGAGDGLPGLGPRAGLHHQGHAGRARQPHGAEGGAGCHERHEPSGLQAHRAGL